MNRLTTVATFDLAAKAEVAKNVLDDAGIPAVITDAEIVAMDWLISNAVGGIKVQVREEDAERAAEVLDERFGAEAGLAAEGLDEDELARQALAAGVPEEVEPEPADEPAEPETGPEPHDEIGRDVYARRALMTAWIGWVIPPVLFYALYLWMNAAFGPGPITNWGRFQVAASGLVVGMYLLIVLSFFSGLVHLS
jgi:hypothetical protein